MAYEYNPQSARFDIPNPHRIENIFLVVCATVCFASAIVLLIDSRGLYLAHDFVRFIKAIVSAVGLLALAVTYTFLLMRQLRFFFGRGQPADLVPSLDADEQGYRAAGVVGGRQIADAAALRQTLQQNAISYRLPVGPIELLLNTLVPDLVYSPRLTQTRVAAQFRNLLGLAFLLVLFPISLIGIHNAAAVGWIGCFYFLLTNAVVLRPLAGGRLTTAPFSERLVIAFIAVAIVVPVVVASLVPPTAYPLRGVIDVVPITFVALLSALLVTLLAFFAGIATKVKPGQINIAPHLETPSVNTTPAQIYTELARELQRLWQEQVPNRTYMRILPDVSLPQGAFTAHVIEETQPIPLDLEPMTFERALALPTTRWLVAVDAACALLTIVGSLLVTRAATVPGAYTALTAGSAVIIVGSFGIRAANEFWRRFVFTSRIYWVDWNGNYSRAATKIGAILADRVHSEREIITVESMTLRVWVADIDSVAFNTDRDRDLVAIRGLPDEAKRLGQWLVGFAENQGSIVAPTSAVDRARLEVMNTLNADAGSPNVLGDFATAATPAIGNGVRMPPLTFCTKCGTQAATPDAAFCGACGNRMASPS